MARPTNYRNIADIKPNPKNPRVIKDEKYRQLMHSLATFPEMLDKRPLVCFTDIDGKLVVLGGNMRLKAATELGMKELPVAMADDWTEEQRAEFLIKDNVGFGEWNWEELQADWDVEKLGEWGLDIPQQFIVEPEATEDDYEIPDEITTDIVLGDLFEIGEHRLLCGDSTDSDAVAKLMDGSKADMVFTDPPYNVDYGANDNPRHKQRSIKNDKMNIEDWNQFVIGYMNSIFQICDANIYISMSDKELGHMQSTFRDCGGKWASFIIWVKDRLVLSPKDYHSRHETILYGWKDGCKDRLRVTDRTQDDVWEIKRPGNSEEHPTMKPIALMEKAITNSSKTGNLVGDLFLGSGSTMVAAHQLNRKCYGMELDPKYCQVIIDRMRKLDPALIIKKNGVPL